MRSHKLGIHRVRTDDNDLASILNEFPELLVPGFHASDENLNGVEHHLTTTGPPVFSRTRRLHYEQLAVAKAEFKKIEDLGIIRRSNFPWSSPLHITPKLGGGWRPCGDFRCLNAATIDDCYPIPHIGDFNGNLQGKTISSKIDLAQGYHQIPMAESDICKEPSSPSSTTHIPGDLGHTGFVYIRHGVYRNPLQRPYTGPFPVLERNEKYLVINRDGKIEKVTVDRLKTAYPVSRGAPVPSNCSIPTPSSYSMSTTDSAPIARYCSTPSFTKPMRDPSMRQIEHVNKMIT